MSVLVGSDGWQDALDALLDAELNGDTREDEVGPSAEDAANAFLALRVETAPLEGEDHLILLSSLR